MMYKPSKPLVSQKMSQISVNQTKWSSNPPESQQSKASVGSSSSAFLHSHPDSSNSHAFSLPASDLTLHPQGGYWNLLTMTQDRVFRKAWHHVLFQTDAVGPQWGMRLPVQRLHCVLSIMWSRHEAINPFFEEIPLFRFTKWWGVQRSRRNVAGMHLLTDTSRCAGIWFAVWSAGAT